MSDHVVVAGNGMVGQRFVEALKDRDTERQWRVTVLSEEPRGAYDRVNLSSCFEGSTPETLNLVPDGCYGTDGYELRLGEPATAIDPAARTVTGSGGDVLSYDALVLATGSYPFVPPVPGADLPGCFVYRTAADVAANEGPRATDAGPVPPEVGTAAAWQSVLVVRDELTPADTAALARVLSEGTWTHDYPITVEEARLLGLTVTTGMPRIRIPSSR